MIVLKPLMKARPLIVGTTARYPEVNALTVAAGRYFSEAEVEHRRNVVVLGDTPAQALFDSWLAPLRDLDARRNVLPGITNTDHLSFKAAGVPVIATLLHPRLLELVASGCLAMRDRMKQD